MNRISRVALILCAGCVSVAWGQQPSGKCLNNWSEFHRTNMVRWNPCEKVLGVNNIGNLVLKWRNRDTGYRYIWSSPAVANGVVYVDSNDGNVYALNAKTGAKLWSYTTGNGESSPAVANGVVYLGSYDKKVYALNAKTGVKLWSYTTGSDVESSPAVTNGVVYVVSDDNNVYALNAKTGTKVWSYFIGIGAYTSSPAVANGVMYVGSIDHNVYALNAKTGTKLWSHATSGQVISSLAVTNGMVFVVPLIGDVHAFGLK
jgi:outer membrane protein assembly factor BamB